MPCTSSSLFNSATSSSSSSSVVEEASRCKRLSIPTRSQAAKGGGDRANRGASADGRGAAGDPSDPTSFQGRDKLRASGQSDAAVPAKYRKRVGEYFQRVADEIGQ